MGTALVVVRLAWIAGDGDGIAGAVEQIWAPIGGQAPLGFPALDLARPRRARVGPTDPQRSCLPSPHSFVVPNSNSTA